jgi:hypothetical protein
MSRFLSMVWIVTGVGLVGFPLYAPAAGACSCSWNGPFLTVSKDSPLVIRGRIIRHHTGPSPTMDVLVLETLKGALLDSGMVVQMGDGMHCRPSLDGFPPGSEWILALNGPGAKPGKGLALSHCGEYWLRVENDYVVGAIDDTAQKEKRMPLSEFTNRLHYPHFTDRITGRVTAGERFRRPFGGRFEFILDPTPSGWLIVITEYGRDENLSRLTPPLHFVPNPREIEGWHLSDTPTDCTTRPYAAESGPENPRKFIFSPEVGTRIDAATSGRSITPDDIEVIQRFGRGTFEIGRFKLEPGQDGCPTISFMEFSVRLDGGY